MKKIILLFILSFLLINLTSCKLRTKTLTDEQLYRMIEDKYFSIDIDNVYPSINSFDHHDLERMNIKYSDNVLEKYKYLDAMNVQRHYKDDYINILYFKTTDGEDKLVYHIKEIIETYGFRDFLYLTDYPFTYTYDELKEELLTIDNEIVQNTLIPMFDEGNVYLGNPNTEPITFINHYKYPEYVTQLPFVFKNETTYYTVTLINDTLYIYNPNETKFIYPTEMTDDEFYNQFGY